MSSVKCRWKNSRKGERFQSCSKFSDDEVAKPLVYISSRLRLRAKTSKCVPIAQPYILRVETQITSAIVFIFIYLSSTYDRSYNAGEITRVVVTCKGEKIYCDDVWHGMLAQRKNRYFPRNTRMFWSIKMKVTSEKEREKGRLRANRETRGSHFRLMDLIDQNKRAPWYLSLSLSLSLSILFSLSCVIVRECGTMMNQWMEGRHTFSSGNFHHRWNLCA